MTTVPLTDLSLDVTPDDGCTIVTVGGEIDLSTAQTLRDALHDLIGSGSPNLVVDLRGVRFLDSTALGVLIGAMRAAREHQGDVHLVCTPGRVAKVLEITRLDQAFAIYTDVDGARAFGG